jgi:hypothetical protein
VQGFYEDYASKTIHKDLPLKCVVKRKGKMPNEEVSREEFKRGS